MLVRTCVARLRFSQRCCEGFRSSEILRSFEQIVPDVSKGSMMFIFRVKRLLDPDDVGSTRLPSVGIMDPTTQHNIPEDLSLRAVRYIRYYEQLCIVN